CSQDVELPITF
nr:immunoglobulin light chain junction region [Macaca mulatta]MOX48110.1 immunoglobulin light chain junction region [Macaca mulatta]MOX48367.1 immunoglobulin light chain junction region [Macaca mulatta]MOX48536.1 immunoglobulin light chain junction region [Macaca mulatta]MOX48923.1 immunoglobulin light chain junction region [Macaca mulatta]